MAYHCELKGTECDGCQECIKPKIICLGVCEDCGNDSYYLRETEIGYLCPECYENYIER